MQFLFFQTRIDCVNVGAFSQRPLKGAPAYGACNGAIESLGKALAVELAPIRVNVVSPGTIQRK